MKDHQLQCADAPRGKTVWQDIEWVTPADWEMTRYGLRYERGVCTYQDEWGERMQLAWQRDAAPLDFDRLVSDLRANEASKAKEAGESVQLEPIHTAAWHGLFVAGAAGACTRAVRYFDADRTTVELTLFWRDRRDADAERAILESIAICPTAPVRHWQAFGLDVNVPAHYHLYACRCYPGDVTLTFAPRRGRRRLSARRQGFPDIWLKGPLDDWLRKQRTAPWQIDATKAVTNSVGHTVVTQQSHRLAAPLLALMGRACRCVEAALLCPEEKRVYYVCVEGSARRLESMQARCACGCVLLPPSA